MSRWRRFSQIASDYLRAAVTREWPLALLALLSLAPGVAALVAWLQVAWRLRDQLTDASGFGWLLPPMVMDAITPLGVLVGSGIVTLLIGCLGLSNAYLTGVERRLGDLALLLSLGLRRVEVTALLLAEALGLAALGTGFGLLGGLVLSAVSWPAARDYFQLPAGFTVAGEPFLIGALAGVLAALLFVGLTGIATVLRLPQSGLRSHPLRHWMRDWGFWRFSTLGILFTALLTVTIGVLALELRAALALTALALALAILLNAGSWLLTYVYWQLPAVDKHPFWGLAVQGLARHRRQTVGMTLAMTAGALGVGLAVLGSLGRAREAIFPLWVVAVLLAACASLVMTTAALAALERRQELGLLGALGARPGQVRSLILLEQGVVALGGGSLGAFMALIAWILAGTSGSWWLALLVTVLDVVAALVTAWLGAAPVLWLISRQPPGVSLRNRPWLAN